MKKFYALLFAGLITTALSQAQTTITLSATQDNTIYVEATNNSNGAGQNFTAGVTDRTANIRRGLLRFDLASVPAGATITNVSLRMVVDRSFTPSHNILLQKMLQAWG